jgi:hypothetical protein
MRERPSTEAAFPSMLQIADNIRQAVNKVLNPTIFISYRFRHRLWVLAELGVMGRSSNKPISSWELRRSRALGT